MTFRLSRLGTAALAAALTLTPLAVQAQAPTFPSFTFKNLLHNPRMDIYPATTSNVYTSSTISGTLTGLNTTPTYHAGRWAVWANAGGASVTVSNTTSNLPTGFANAETVLRAASNTSTQPICIGQQVRSADVIALQGQVVAFSAWIAAGGSFSAASSNVSFNIYTGTGTDQSLATFLSGWTGAATPVSTTQTISTTWRRYAVTGTIPSTATELLAAICWTPVGTAGSADSISVTGLQLEQGSTATPLENRPQTVEQQLILPYTYVLTDGAATRRYQGACIGVTANTTVGCVLALPQTMRAVPTTTIGTATSFGITQTNSTASTCSTLAATSTSNTVNAIGLTCTTSGTIAQGGASLFIGAATGGLILVSADF